MARHGHKVRAPLIHGDGQDPGRLGGVHQERDGSRPAAGGDLADRQDIAEDVGDVGADDSVRPLFQLPIQVLQELLRLKEGGFHRPRPHPRNGGQRTGDGVMLPAGEEDPSPRPHHGLYRQVQPVGGVVGQDDLLRPGHPKELCRLLPEGQEGPGGPAGGTVVPPAGTGHRPHRLRHGPGHRRGLLEGGGGAVQIDHSDTSRQCSAAEPT